MVPRFVERTKLSVCRIHCSAQRNDGKWTKAAEILAKCQPAIEEGVYKSVTLGVQIGIASVVLIPMLGMFSWIWHKISDMNKKVMKKFENPDLPSLIQEEYHIPRAEEDEIRAFLNQTDDFLGLVCMVFGPAGTGKSNVVRTVCRDQKKGVIYMEIGSPRQFPYHLAKACGVPVEPNLLDALVNRLFPTWKTHISLPDRLESKDEDALALVLPVIAKGGEAYKVEHECAPVLFIDGIDILAKQRDKNLYLNLVDWAKKCVNENSLRIVFVCSDSHIWALDQQWLKSRLENLIEIDDIQWCSPKEGKNAIMHIFDFIS